MKKKTSFLISLIVLLSCLVAGRGWARTTSTSANIFNPAIDDSYYFTISGSQSMQQWRYQMGVFFHYSNDPLEFGIAGVRSGGVVNNFLVADVFGALGLTDWWQIALGLPIGILVDFNNPLTTSYFDLAAGASDRSLRLGDVRFETKLRLIDIDRYSVGLALIPYLTFPTGSGSRLFGNNSFSGGGKFVFDVNFKRRVNISINVGYLAKKSVTSFNTLQDDMFTFGAGLNIKTVQWLDLIAEMFGSTRAGNLFKRQSESPIEADAGIRIYLPKPQGLAITLGGGLGMTFGFGAPDYRAFLGITYPNPKTYYLPEPPPPPPPAEEPLAIIEEKKIVISRKIHFEFDKAVIRSISFPIVDAVVQVMVENPEVRKVRVEGHTDYKGSDAYNLKLSQMRAEAVVKYLIDHGIESDRVVAVGYGESQPIDTNETEKGRARNRRVEFTILEQSGWVSETDIP